MNKTNKNLYKILAKMRIYDRIEEQKRKGERICLLI